MLFVTGNLNQELSQKERLGLGEISQCKKHTKTIKFLETAGETTIFLSSAGLNTLGGSNQTHLDLLFDVLLLIALS